MIIRITIIGSEDFTTTPRVDEISHSLDFFLVLHLAHIFLPPLNFPVELPFNDVI